MRYVSYVDFATHRRATVMTRLCLYKKKLKKKKKKKRVVTLSLLQEFWITIQIYMQA